MTTTKALRPTSDAARCVLAVVLHPGCWVALDHRGWVFGGGNNLVRLRAAFPTATILSSEAYRAAHA